MRRMVAAELTTTILVNSSNCNKSSRPGRATVHDDSAGDSRERDDMLYCKDVMSDEASWMLFFVWFFCSEGRRRGCQKYSTNIQYGRHHLRPASCVHLVHCASYSEHCCTPVLVFARYLYCVQKILYSYRYVCI